MDIYDKATERAAMALFDACTGSSLFWAPLDDASKESWCAAVRDEIDNVGKPLFSVRIVNLEAQVAELRAENEHWIEVGREIEKRDPLYTDDRMILWSSSMAVLRGILEANRRMRLEKERYRLDAQFYKDELELEVAQHADTIAARDEYFAKWDQTESALAATQRRCSSCGSPVTGKNEIFEGGFKIMQCEVCCPSGNIGGESHKVPLTPEQETKRAQTEQEYQEAVKQDWRNMTTADLMKDYRYALDGVSNMLGLGYFKDHVSPQERRDLIIEAIRAIRDGKPVVGVVGCSPKG